MRGFTVQPILDAEIDGTKMRDTISPRISAVGQDARVLWEFRTSESPKLVQLSGSAFSKDSRNVQIQIHNFSNTFSIPVCVLHYSGRTDYEFMLVTNRSGQCTETILLVRNLDMFFNKNNAELISYLKNKIANEEIESMGIVPFANGCS
ncbi:hypothetical protein RB195_025011 [Necator americanus]|uniref:Immunoglobulin I-set domain-containing protein n=1 Tax=Necator americanus TaxID=51031 RepID=A0ABR1EQM4_NECAM